MRVSVRQLLTGNVGENQRGAQLADTTYAHTLVITP